MLTLYDADRCPYCARVRIVLAEKGLEWETVVIDLGDRPAWLYEKNSTGRVPVLEEDALVLPESVVILEYLDERYPEPPLLPSDPAERALARLWIERFDVRLGEAYYAVRHADEAGRPELEACVAELDRALEARPYLTGQAYGLADIAYLPWILRARMRLGVDFEPYPSLAAWIDLLSQRPAVAPELELATVR